MEPAEKQMVRPTLLPINNLQHLVQENSAKIAKLAHERDCRLNEAETITRSMYQLQQIKENNNRLEHIYKNEIPVLVSRTSRVAFVIKHTAENAQEAANKVKRLKLLLQHAEQVQQRIRAVQEMAAHTAELPNALRKGDWSKAVELISAYEEAEGKAKSTDEYNNNSSNNNDSEENYNLSDIVSESETDTSDNSDESVNNASDDKMHKDKEKTHLAKHKESSKRELMKHAKEQVVTTLLSKIEAISERAHSRHHTTSGVSIKVSNNKIDDEDEDEDGLYEEEELEGGSSNNNNNKKKKEHDKMQKYCALLARLGMVTDTSHYYCNYICNTTINQITLTVEQELHKMDDPAMAAMSHLGLVSQCLDTIVATYETETRFVQDTFGNAGLLYLLHELHRRCTSACVPVLQNFMSKRKEMLMLSDSQRIFKCDNISSSHNTNKQTTKQGKDKDKHITTTTSSSSPRREVKESEQHQQQQQQEQQMLIAEARQMDRMLEEMTHLVECCHLYLSFLERSEKECQAEDASKKAGKEVTNTNNNINSSSNNNNKEHKQANDDSITYSTDHLWTSQDNELLREVQELLSLYVPLQQQYFKVVFKQATALQEITLYGVNRLNYKTPFHHSRSSSSNNSDSNKSRTNSLSPRQRSESASTKHHIPLSGRANSSHSNSHEQNDNNTTTIPLQQSSSADAEHNPSSTSSLSSSASSASFNRQEWEQKQQQENLQTAAVSSPLSERVLGRFAHSPRSASSGIMSGLSNLYAAAAQGVQHHVNALVRSDSDNEENPKHVSDKAGNKSSSAKFRAEHHTHMTRKNKESQMILSEWDNTNTIIPLESSKIVIADDVFFVLRIAMHRALNMHSTQITSAVMMAVSEVIQNDLAEYITLHIDEEEIQNVNNNSSHNNNNNKNMTKRVDGNVSLGVMHSQVPAITLKWIATALLTSEYTTKLMNEIHILSQQHYSNHDVIRFRELSQDLQIAARDLEQRVRHWLHLCAERIASLCFPFSSDNKYNSNNINYTSSYFTRLQTLSYVMDEDTFYQYELTDPWVQLFLIELDAILSYYNHWLDHTSFDVLLTELAAQICTILFSIYMQKVYSTFGALQVDKEVRAIREFVYGKAHENMPRQAFGKLTLLSTLLLCDRPRDAIEESRNTNLTSEEKRAVLLRRVEFNKEEVMNLKL